MRGGRERVTSPATASNLPDSASPLSKVAKERARGEEDLAAAEEASEREGATPAGWFEAEYNN